MVNALERGDRYAPIYDFRGLGQLAPSVMKALIVVKRCLTIFAVIRRISN
jgi:hypothetical protein